MKQYNIYSGQCQWQKFLPFSAASLLKTYRRIFTFQSIRARHFIICRPSNTTNKSEISLIDPFMILLTLISICCIFFLDSRAGGASPTP